MRPPGSILETILYATDLNAASAFYTTVLGLEPLSREPSELSVGFRVGPGQVLLIFNPAVSGRPGRAVPSHGSTGPGHVAFRVPPADLGAWVDHLASHNVDVEKLITWDGTEGHSVYCRDPAGNSVELIDADIWPNPGRPLDSAGFPPPL